MPYLTLGQASKETGLHKTTISRAVEDGRLSANRNQQGHYQIDPAELFRVFDPVARDRDVTPERNTMQPPEQHDTTPVVTGTVTESYLVERLRELEEELEDKDARLDELRQAMSALPSPESVELEKEQLREKHTAQLEQERVAQARLIAEEKQRTEKWKSELQERQSEIKQAREEADRISQKAAEDIATIERRAASERAVREALESRGFIDRLLNRKPALAK